MIRGSTYAKNAYHMHHRGWALAGASGGSSKSEGWSAHVLLLGYMSNSMDREIRIMLAVSTLSTKGWLLLTVDLSQILC